MAHCPFAEVAWYFPITRQQFRIRGELQIIGASHEGLLQEARHAKWRGMSESGRSQFAWPHPGLPRLDGDAALAVDDASLVAAEAPPLPTFCLVVMTPDEVEELSLKKNRRWQWKASAEWKREEVNP